VIGRGASLKTYMGKDKVDIIWICFPKQEKSCTLAHTQDIFWNSEKLGVVLENYVDAITVSRAIQEFNKYLKGFL